MLKQNVLRKKADFDRIYRNGKSAGDKLVVVFLSPNREGTERTAFLASKKVGNSVERNRARRLMKESYRNLKREIPENSDIIFIARNTIKGAKQQEVEASIRGALSKLERNSGKIKNEHQSKK